jgi:hypothetical protein
VAGYLLADQILEILSAPIETLAESRNASDLESGLAPPAVRLLRAGAHPATPDMP